MGAIYSRTNIKASVATMISGTVSDADQNTLLNRAVREVIGDAEIDIRSTKRKTAMVPNIFDDVWDHTCPTDLKARKIIDIKPQIKREKSDEWRLTTEEEFDRLKGSCDGEKLVAISDADFVRKIKISKEVEDYSVTIDSLDAVGTWVVYGDGTNLTVDSSNFVQGSACLNWDISAAGGTTAGIVNSSITAIDISEYLSEGSILVWAYITSTTNLTNYKIRIGSGSSAYSEITVTTTNEGVAFQTGWNLLRFDLINKSVTGSPVNTACTYVALFMTKAAGKISETDYRFDNIVLKKGVHYDLIYYSKFSWQSSTGTWLENSTADTDYLNYDTEELQLIEYKSAELMERHLKNHGEADRYYQLYTVKSKAYQLTSPSEAMLMTTTY